MNKLRFPAFTAALAFCIGGPAGAQTFHSHPVRVAGSTNVQVEGINNAGVMVVNYADSTGLAHCEIIDGSTVTQIADPNEQGTAPGNGTSCYGINNLNQVVGAYSLAPFGNGFLYNAGTYTDILAAPSGGGTTAYGINDSGDVVGSFIGDGGQHGFLYNGSTFEQLDVPGASATLAIGINNGGEISLTAFNSSSIASGATLRNGHYKTLNVPNMTNTEALAINVHGWINLIGQDSSGAWHGFLYKGGAFTEYNVTNATNTFGYGLNDAGKLTGGYNPSSAPSDQIGFTGSITK